METRMIPRNLMEELVADKLDEYILDAGVCTCERCRADIMALALNKLPPRYIVSISGDVYSRFDAVKTQFQADVIITVLNAIEVIKSRPRHE